MSTLDELRGRVEAIDRSLVRLIAERRRVVGEIAATKRVSGLAPVDPEREEALRMVWEDAAQAEGLPPAIALATLNTLLASSRAHVVEIFNEPVPGGPPRE